MVRAEKKSLLRLGIALDLQTPLGRGLVDHGFDRRTFGTECRKIRRLGEKVDTVDIHVRRRSGERKQRMTRVIFGTKQPLFLCGRKQEHAGAFWTTVPWCFCEYLSDAEYGGHS